MILSSFAALSVQRNDKDPDVVMVARTRPVGAAGVEPPLEYPPPPPPPPDPELVVVLVTSEQFGIPKFCQFEAEESPAPDLHENWLRLINRQAA